MIDPSEFGTHAWDLVFKPSGHSRRDPTEIELRRALSSAYYGLFHCLTTAGSMPFTAGGEAIRFQAARAFNHSAMRKVCDAYVRSPLRPFAPPLEHLSPHAPDRRLIRVAAAFGQLQDGRHAADYDLSASIDFDYVAQLVRVARLAHAQWYDIKSLPETTVFLTALLLADRWTRRG